MPSAYVVRYSIIVWSVREIQYQQPHVDKRRKRQRVIHGVLPCVSCREPRESPCLATCGCGIARIPRCRLTATFA